MPQPPNQSQAARAERSGLIAGIAAFGTWGLIPIYWKLLANIPASEILAHRFVWTTLFLVLLLSWQRRWPEVREATRSRRALLYCFASGIAISVTAGSSGRKRRQVIETSLGYFRTPLVNVLFGALFLRERLALAIHLGDAGPRRRADLTFVMESSLARAHPLRLLWSLRVAQKKIRRGAFPALPENHLPQSPPPTWFSSRAAENPRSAPPPGRWSSS